MDSIADLEIFPGRPLSISGVALQGDRLLHSIYLDETGISVNEPVALVAGVIINEDLQWKSVEKAISDLITEYVPEEHREGFSFHATDLYHCSGKIFHHTKYPRERAREALKQLLSIPRMFEIPIACGYLTKSDYEIPVDQFDASGKAKLYHALAYFVCVIAAETYMVNFRPPQELARLIAELNTETHKVVKMAHKLLQGKLNPELIQKLANQFEVTKTFLPLRRIVDSVHFAEKEDAILLQLADACAFVLRYWAQGKSGQYIDEYFEAFIGPRSNVFATTPRVPFFNGTFIFHDGIAKQW